MHPFLTIDDLLQTLDGVVGIYAGTPVWVSASTPGRNNFVRINPLINDPIIPRYKDVPVTDKQLELHVYDIGYINHYPHGFNRPIECVWCMRVPARRWRQGLHINNVMIGSHWATGQELRSKGFNNMLINEYPKYTDAVQWVFDRRADSVAFSRDLAVRYTGGRYELHFQGEAIAMFNEQIDNWCWLPGNSQSRSFFNVLLIEHGVEVEVD